MKIIFYFLLIRLFFYDSAERFSDIAADDFQIQIALRKRYFVVFFIESFIHPDGKLASDDDPVIRVIGPGAKLKIEQAVAEADENARAMAAILTRFRAAARLLSAV